MISDILLLKIYSATAIAAIFYVLFTDIYKLLTM